MSWICQKLNYSVRRLILWQPLAHITRPTNLQSPVIPFRYPLFKRYSNSHLPEDGQGVTAVKLCLGHTVFSPHSVSGLL